MMGERQVAQESLFYSFNLEQHLPADHLLRSIDRFVDLSDIREHLRPFYSEIGRPSIDPELMIRILIIGYCMGIRSERRLCEEVHLNLAYRWFCRLGLEGDVPDHSTFSKARHGRFRDSDLLRRLFETTVARCMAEGLVGGQGFAVDASVIRADVHHHNIVMSADELPPPDSSRAIREYLEVLDDAAFGAAVPSVPKRFAVADPAARWSGTTPPEPPRFSYSTNYLIDLEHSVIMDVEASAPVRPAEVNAAKTMIERVEERFGIWPEKLVGDTAYGTAETLAWLVHKRGIEPHIPVYDMSVRKGTFERSDFTYDIDRDLYTCPAGHELRRAWQKNRVYKEGPVTSNGNYYSARARDCRSCDLRSQCCLPAEPARKIFRSVHEGARDLARDIARSDAYLVSKRERKKIEMLFAHLKRILKLGRLRLRGPNGAKDEFLLAATAQNLRKLAKIVPMPAVPALA